IELTPLLIPTHDALVEIPPEPFQARILEHVSQFALNFINRSYQFEFRFNHAIVGLRDRRCLSWEAKRFEEAERGEIVGPPHTRCTNPSAATSPGAPYFAVQVLPTGHRRMPSS